MKKCLFSILFTLASASVFAQSDVGTDAAIKRYYRDSMIENMTHYFGYPLCSQVMLMRKLENEALILAHLDDEPKKRFNEMGRTNFSDEFVEQQKDLSDLPSIPDYYKRSRPVCFLGNVSVKTMDADKTEARFEQISLIFDEGNSPSFVDETRHRYVLASTTHIWPSDRDYHYDCWAQIIKAHRGLADPDEDLIDVKFVTGNISSQVSATEKHRFYLVEKNKWVKASELNSGDHLQRTIDQICEVEATNKYTVEKYKDENLNWFKRNILDGHPYVFNLTTNVFSYYVGSSENLMALVHNAY
ncbi:MAG: hypothetical protein KDD48_06645 [Bdellovibrionales bacterium]|nr:hypothetical protein [Bdellovibrionales bacterium]